MTSHELRITANGGIEIIIADENGTERSVFLEPDDNGNIRLKRPGTER